MAWQEDALLYAIVPSYTMARNLGADVGDRPGWVFKFGRPGARMELFVHVVEGEVRSIVQAHPVYFEQPPESLPIDMQSINLDSPQVLQAFALEGYPGYLGQHQEPKLDYELVHLTGTRNPIWTLWDDTTGLALLHVDAVTGQETDDPRGGT